MAKTLEELQNITDSNPAYVLIDAVRVETERKEIDGVTPVYEMMLIGTPDAYRLVADPIPIEDNTYACVIEDTNYVAPAEPEA